MIKFAIFYQDKIQILPAARDLKFSHVLGTVSLNSSMKTVPAGTPSTVMSKNTMGRRATSAGVGAKIFGLGFESNPAGTGISLARIGIGIGVGDG